MTIRVTPFTNNALKKYKNIQKELEKLPDEALDEFVSLTPIRSGNARRSTSLQGKTIEANYPYAQRLDEGYSRQAPRGIVKPFQEWLSKKYKDIIKRAK